MNLTRFNTQSIILYLEAQPCLLRHGLAMLTVAIAAIATLYIPPIGERAAFLLFFFAIIQTSFWLGQNPGIFAMILSLIAVNVLILFPAGIETYNVLILNAGFCFMSVGIIATTSFHRKSTAALWESRQDLDYAQTVGKIGSWRLSVQRNELRWSNENYRIFGLPRGTRLSFESFLSRVHPDDREFVNLNWQAGRRGEPYEIEYRLIVEGKVKWVREKAVLEFNKKGNLLGGFGTTQDITSYKRNEQALRESRQRYVGIVESALDAMITIDADQRILLFNAAAERMFGCTADEAVGGALERFIPERFRPAHAAHIRDFVRTGTTSRKMGELAAVKGLRADGEEFPIEAAISQYEINGEKSFTAILRDATERMRADSALKEQLKLQDQLSKVAETVPGVICSFRLRPDGTACMPYASPVFESVYGLRHDTVAEDFSPIFARIHPRDIGHINEAIAESARTMQPWQDCFRYDHPTKGEIWIEGRSMPLREADGSTLWHGYIQDITREKKAELERQKFISLADNSKEFIGMCDMNLLPFYVNAAGMRIVGLGSLKEALQVPVQEFFFPEDQRFITEEFFPRVFREGIAEVEIRFRHFQTGAAIWMIYNVFYIKDYNGDLAGLATVSRDITARKRAEQALQERESELRLIMDATPALISYLDTNFRYLRINAACLNWFCMTPECILGHEAREIIGEKAWNIVRPYLERARAGERVSFDQVIPYGTGKPRWVHASYIPDRDSTGTVKGIVAHIIDIEERKQAEQQITFLNRHLQRRIEEMQVIFDTVPIGLAITDDSKCCHIRGNPAIEQMLGLPPGSELSLEGTPPATICVMLNGRELTIEELPMQRAISNEVVTNQILDITRPDGQVIRVLSNASPLFNEEGFPRGAVGAFLDITELKRVEESLTKSQTQLRTFIEQAPLSIAMFDREMNYLVTSRRWIEEFGRGYDDLTGRNHYLVNPDISAEWREIHVKAQAGEFLKNDDDLWIQADGSRHWLRWAAYPWTNQEGKIGGIIISCEDITARRTAEEELHTVQTRLALVVEEVKAGYWDWDLNTSTIYLSPEWKRQIGFGDNELLNRWEEWECRLHPDDRASVLAATENYIAGLLPNFELEFRLRHKDGLYRWIHSRGGLLRDKNNHPYRMLGINLDITDYKKQKEMRERRDKMEQSFRLYVVTQTAAAIAHELHQPLAAISSYAEVALHMLQTGSQNPEKLTPLVEICAQQAQRAGGVIRQLMTILHKDETPSESIDINHLVHEALELVKVDGHLGAFNVELDLAVDLPPVRANSLQIEKVLVNLLRNGLESMRESGISAGLITITTRATDDTPAMAQVTVCDSGKCVTDSATVKNMFQPFYTTKSNGLGMGLAISRALIEAHGGTIWAEQNTDNGISVHFTLPFEI
ncbi:PAS domain S-box protein [Methylomicrobium sp. Wu6]|uniref:PAS domain S-box protein n=1 Tax=Methylomicrobium sp. Wu6 TaxID=3107928 RepID=UPI002DD63BE3|nr:PAS domain S-box protein [Methylomicrobium sp. Wu6]MEC4747344.1 PAS domain S-box protein [Methylomicrobium sp. Wu6]